MSINYNGHAANDPSDYFLAPSTEGEPNVMPGDIDGDLDMDQDDYSAFVACLGQAVSGPPCSRADFDASMNVDCSDWPPFTANWATYSPLPEPPLPNACVSCLRGDVNNDGVINGADVDAFVHVVDGDDVDPVHRCAADANANGFMECEDLSAFVRLVLAAESDCAAGDTNLDGILDGGDIQPFIDVLLNPSCRTNAERCSADLNLDSTVSLDDLPLFAELLLVQIPFEKS